MASCNEFFGEALERLNSGASYVPHSNIRVTWAAPGAARGELAVGPENFGLGDTVHGGGLMTLADTVGGAAAMTLGGVCVTLDSSFHFLRPALGPTIRCAARVRKPGRTVRVVEVTLTNAADEEVACGSFTFYVKDEGREKARG